MPERVFAGDDEQFFPAFGIWVKPGDVIPEDWPDDTRFVPAKRTRKHDDNATKEQ